MCFTLFPSTLSNYYPLNRTRRQSLHEIIYSKMLWWTFSAIRDIMSKHMPSCIYHRTAGNSFTLIRKPCSFHRYILRLSFAELMSTFQMQLSAESRFACSPMPQTMGFTSSQYTVQKHRGGVDPRLNIDPWRSDVKLLGWSIHGMLSSFTRRLSYGRWRSFPLESLELLKLNLSSRTFWNLIPHPLIQSSVLLAFWDLPTCSHGPWALNVGDHNWVGRTIRDLRFVVYHFILEWPEIPSTTMDNVQYSQGVIRTGECLYWSQSETSDWSFTSFYHLWRNMISGGPNFALFAES